MSALPSHEPVVRAGTGVAAWAAASKEHSDVEI